MRLASLSLALLVATAAAASAGCHHSGPRTAWSASQVSSAEVRITPSDVSVSRDRLYVKTTLVNTSVSTLTVERDAVLLKLPDGRAVRRSTGITSTHKPYTVAPGASQNVWVDFLPAEDFDWSRVASAEVDFSQAVHAGAAVVPVPPLVLTRTDLAVAR
jgi:hypothetical protein